ncbi:MAG: beta-hydroxyacyl-ACP dehydratase [Phycisphaerales bacterium]|nr:beta-hydroxyacyl-ACP dehydratase [Phycisphaerales bacterium]
MHFSLIDRVIECSPDRIVAIKNVSAAEEYLEDHFPTFPVLPGVLMVEAIVQAARHMLEKHYPACRGIRMVLGSVRAVKYGRFVKPGETLRVEVSLCKQLEGGAFEFKAQGTVAATGIQPEPNGEPANSAISGKFILRPVREFAAA